MKVKDRVQILEDKAIERDEFGKGQFGIITEIEDNQVSIQLELFHIDLLEWENCFIYRIEDLEYFPGFPGYENCDETVIMMLERMKLIKLA